MQHTTINLRNWAPIGVAVLAILLIVGLFGNGGHGPAGAIDPNFGLTALAGFLSGAVNLALGILPIILVAVVGLCLVRWWLAPEDATAPQQVNLVTLLGSSTPRREVACPNCATPVQDGWQACPSCGYRMHVMNTLPACGNCHQPVDRTWSVCPHCASTLPKVPDEQRIPAHQMVEAARRHNLGQSASLAPLKDDREVA